MLHRGHTSARNLELSEVMFPSSSEDPSLQHCYTSEVSNLFDDSLCIVHVCKCVMCVCSCVSVCILYNTWSILAVVMLFAALLVSTTVL